MTPLAFIKILVTVVLVAGLSPFLEGFMRKLKAMIHSRIGPPIYQPYLDIIKLLGKEDLQVSDNPILRVAPITCFAAVLTASLFVSFGYAPALNGSGDVIAFIYLITLSSVAIFMGGLASANPYAAVGSSRELMMLFTVEPVLAITLVVASIKANSMVMTRLPVTLFSISMAISAIGFFLAIQAQMAKLPFDIVEADQEIMEGPFIEYSGPGLALFKWSFYMKEYIFASLFWRVFVNWPDFHRFDMPGVLATALNTAANFVEVLVLLALVEIIDVVNPRLRIDQSLRYFGTVVFMAMCGLGFALIGS
jgi:formate hydrogenlyase subunit 4